MISPEVEGTFVHNGRVWIFKPNVPLQADTVYTVTVLDTLKRGEESISEAVQSTFSTYASANTNSSVIAESVKYSSITVDKISTFRPMDSIAFRLIDDKTKVARVEILKLNHSTDFQKFLNKDTSYQSQSLGDFSFQEETGGLYILNDHLDIGYYVMNAYLNNGDLLFSMPVQVSDISAYLVSTQEDILVWVGKDDSLLEGVNIHYGSQTIKTNKEGIAIFNHYNTLENKVQYITVGDDNPIYIGVNTFDRIQYPNGYIYTDRPLYKNTDEIQIWGYVPLTFFKEFEDFSEKDFVLSINDVTVPVSVLSDGTFITKYSLDNYKDGSVSIVLKYKNKNIVSHYVDVIQYQKEMYDFSINMDKNYVKAGEKFHFTVSVQHISGVMVPNKEINATVEDRVYTSVTDSNGVASFDIDTSMNSSEGAVTHMIPVRVTSSLSEYSSKGITFYAHVLDRFASFENTNYDKEKKTFTATVYNLTDKPSVNKLTWDCIPFLKDTKYSGNVEVNLIESVSTSYISGYKYNEITKENIPQYYWNYVENTVASDNILVEDGKLSYKILYDFKKSTEDTHYSYHLEFFLMDRFGNRYNYSGYISTGNHNSSINGYYSSSSYTVSSDYNLYDYYFSEESKQYSVSDLISRDLFHYTGSFESDENPLLMIKYKNTILDHNILKNNGKNSLEFTQEDVPGINTTSAYFKDGVFYRMPSEYKDYKEEDSRLDIQITPTASSYKPKDKVTVEVYVSKNGKGVPAKVNISVVDEGVFKLAEDSTDILERIYYNKYFYQYTYSTYRDYSLYILGGGDGSTSGGERADFGDTIYFDMVETDKNGKAKVTFTLNDSITSFRITAHAANEKADVGVSHTNITSSIPIAISTIEPRGLKKDDEVVLNAVGIGDTKEEIKYEFSIDGVDSIVQKTGLVGKSVYASFGTLPVGEYTAHIKASSGKASDALRFNFVVSNTQTELSVKNTANIKELKTINPTKNPIKLEFFLDSYKDYSDFLDIIHTTNEERLDTKFTYVKALEYENRYLEDNHIVELGDVSGFRGSNGWRFLLGEEVSSELTAILSYYDESFRFDKNIYYDMIAQNGEDIEKVIDAYLVLAAMREPILDDLNILVGKISNIGDYSSKIALAYLFLGDYKQARSYVIKDPGVATYLSTFLKKEKASSNIHTLYQYDNANRYLYFSIVSYFENNNVDLNKTEDVIVSYGEEKKTLSLAPLGKKYLTVYQKNLDTLSFEYKYDDINVNYYYEGGIDEIADSNKVVNISSSLSNENPALGDTIMMNVDLSQIKDSNNILIYLPNGLRLSTGFKSDYASILYNRMDHVSIGIINNNQHRGEIQIPLYVSSPGKYVIEPIVIKNGDHYQLSNSLTVNIHE